MNNLGAVIEHHFGGPLMVPEGIGTKNGKIISWPEGLARPNKETLNEWKTEYNAAVLSEKDQDIANSGRVLSAFIRAYANREGLSLDQIHTVIKAEM